jgi:xylulokinase
MVNGDGSVDDSMVDEQQHGTLFAGFDIGTSGCRVSIIEPLPSSSVGFREVYCDSMTWKDCVRNMPDNTTIGGRYDDPESWWIAIESLFMGCSPSLLDSVASICVSGTSASCLILDRTTLEVTRKPRMYDYEIVTSSSNEEDNASGLRAMELLQNHLPSKHTARSSTGSFAKLVKWILQSPLERNEFLCHQSDYISTKLIYSPKDETEFFQQHSDWQNCLKLGYDVRNLRWPMEDWMGACMREAIEISESDDDCEDTILRILPTKVVSPGAPIGIVHEKVAKKLGLSKDVIVVGGTTDSNAAFYAAAASRAGSTDNDASSDKKIKIPYGTAVTSLGSTTAIKFLSKTYVEDSTLGVYSHRFPSRDVFATTKSNDEGNGNNNLNDEAWLVGGASNVGCAIFRALDFSDKELKDRSKNIDPTTDSEAYLRHGYYPLLPNKVGERFPLADATKKAILEPLPDIDDEKVSDVRTEYLKGLFQSISTEVECKGYEVLRDLGATPPFPIQIMTAGGGSRNDVWTSLRQRIMNESVDRNTEKVEVKKAEQSEASYGAALLAAAGYRLRD